MANGNVDWNSVLEFLEPEPPKFCPHAPTPKQKAFLRTEALEVLYGGRAGGGKSDALLMGALQWVHVPNYAALLLRNTFADLALPGALMDRAQEWFEDVEGVHSSGQKHQFEFPSGATITFGYIDKPNDHLKYKSAEFQYIGFDEVTEIRENHYRYLFSRLRRPSGRAGLALSKVPLRMRAASNPAPNWVRRRFIEEGKAHGRLYIPAGLIDNPFVDHVAYTQALGKLDEVERARLESGDWYAEESGAKFSREWFHPLVNPEELPHKFEDVVRYWDLAATIPSDRNPDPDYTVGAKVGLYEGFLYVLDMRIARLDSGDVEKLVLRTAEEDGPSVKIRMEQEPGASGKYAVDNYARYVLLGYDFDGHPAVRNKEQRADVWAPKAKRKEVKFLRGGDWITTALDQLVAFGAVDAHDDVVDALSGAIEHLIGLGGAPQRGVQIIV